MRVCLDARKLNDSGIGTYIRGLLFGFQQMGGDVEFDFIAQPQDAESACFSFANAGILFSRAKGYSLSELFTISPLANRTQAQLFHAPHYAIPLGLKLPLVVTVHDLIHLKFPQYFSAPQRAYAHWMLRRMSRQARLILTVSQRTKDDLVETFKIAPEQIVVSFSGVAERFFDPIDESEADQFLQRRGLPPGYLLYVGNLKPHKNVSGLIASWAQLSDSIRPPLVVVGENKDEYASLRELTHRLGQDREVYFPGALSDAEMTLLYHAAAAYAQPSWYEGFGFPPLEAMAAGVPTLVSNRGSLPEVVQEAALVFDPESREQFVQGLERILTDQTLRESLIERGKLRAAQFSWAKCAQRTLDAYQKALLSLR